MKAIWFLLILGPVIRSPLGAFGDTSLLASLIYIVWSMGRGSRLHKSIMPFVAISALITIGAFVNTLLLSDFIDSASIQVILRPAKAVLILLGLYFAVTRLSRSRWGGENPRENYLTLLRVVYAAIVIHAGIILLQYLFPAVLNLTYQVVGGGEVLAINKKFRMPGLAGAGGAQVAATQGLGFLIGVHLSLMGRPWLTLFIGNVLIVISLVLTGRTGFVVVGVAAVYWVLSILSMRRRERRKTSFSNVVLGIVSVPLAAGVILIGLRFVTSSYSEDIWFARAVDRTFESVTTYMQSGEFSNRTLDELGTMYNFPRDPIRWLIGEARLYDNTLGLYYSDIGYVRLWWGYGLYGVLGYIAFYLLMAVQIGSRRVREAMGAQNVAFGLVVLATVFLLNYKETFFFSRMSYQITVASVMGLFWLTVVDRSRYRGRFVEQELQKVSAGVRL